MLQNRITTPDRDKLANELIHQLNNFEFNFVAYENKDHWLFKVQKLRGTTWEQIIKLIHSICRVTTWYANVAIKDGVEL